MMQYNRQPVKQPLRTPAKTDEFKSFRVFVTLMNDLAAVMDEESAVVHARKFPEQKDIVRRKQRMAMDYRASMKSFTSQPEMLKRLPDDLRAALRAAAQKLSEAADKNARLLRTAMLASQRLLQSIISIVKDERLPKAGYMDTRKGYAKLGTYSPTCKPVSVTRTA
jgi:flagellar biosynthesis/type III secretory pathway chaperone